MYRKPVGVSILTNGARLEYLKSCVFSFLSNNFYRPLVISVFNNGSTDGTREWLQNLPEVYGVTWRVSNSEKDLGCAAGTNRAHDLVSDMEFVLHLESDFRHLTETESGIGKLWLRDALVMLDDGLADYIYLRRMRSDQEMAMHWFHQWRSKIVETKNQFQRCDGFWYSNNPAIFRMSALLKSKTLPLNEKIDGLKGTPNWSLPELSTPHPTKAWLWGYGEGMFVHDG